MSDEELRVTLARLEERQIGNKDVLHEIHVLLATQNGRIRKLEDFQMRLVAWATACAAVISWLINLLF